MRKNKHKIIGVDFDGTLAITEGTYPEITDEITEVLDYVTEEQAKGAYVILITMREGKELIAAVKWCKERGLVFDAVNDNLDFMKEYFRNNPRKIFCTEYIDNTNLGGIDFILKEIRKMEG